MRAQARAELLKIRSTRTTAGLLIALVAVVLLIVTLSGFLSDAESLAVAGNQRDLLSVGALAVLIAALAGVLVVTNEFRFGTIRPTFLVTPRRGDVIAAKVLAALLAGAVFGLVAEGLAFAVGSAILSGRGIPFELGARDVGLIWAGSVPGAALWGALGVGVGALVRNQVGAVIGLLIWVFVIDGLVFGLAPSVGRYFPGRAHDAMMGTSAEHLVSPAAGSALLVAWAAALALAGAAATARRDVD